MNHHCPICGRSVDILGFPTHQTFLIGESTPVLCIGHRLAVAQERFKTARVMVHDGVKVTKETKECYPVHNDL